MAGTFTIQSRFKAKRMKKAFRTKVDGMTLKGLAYDWAVSTPDGKIFPVPDHLFRLLFHPIDDEARKDLDEVHTITIGMEEGVSLGAVVEAVRSRLRPERK